MDLSRPYLSSPLIVIAVPFSQKPLSTWYCTSFSERYSFGPTAGNAYLPPTGMRCAAGPIQTKGPVVAARLPAVSPSTST